MVVCEKMNIWNDGAKLETFILNDTAEIYCVMDRPELHLSFYSISRDGSDIYRFPNRKNKKAKNGNKHMQFFCFLLGTL